MNIRIIVPLVLALAILGCSREASMPTQPVRTALSVVPADGATAVRLDASVALDFGRAVDRAAVEQGLHLFAESDLLASCPDASMGGHSTMEPMMDDPAMLQHMDAMHATAGRFSWNDAGTVCTFTPDSLMRPQTRYMVHLHGGMLEMMRGMGVSMMEGRMNAGGDMLLHFTTMPADDHAGHHS